MRVLSRSRQVAIGVGATLGVASLAFAATLSSGVGGSTTIKDSNTAAALQVLEVNAVNGGPIECRSSVAGNDVTLQPAAKRVDGAIPTSFCEYTIIVRNTGGTPAPGAKVTINGKQAALAGWDVTTGNQVTIPPKGNVSFPVRFTPQEDATGTGSFVGTLTAGDGSVQGL